MQRLQGHCDMCRKVNLGHGIVSVTGNRLTCQFDQFPFLHLISFAAEKIRFVTGASDLDIIITNPAPKIYSNAGVNNVNLKSDTGEFWHMIIVSYTPNNNWK